jgi:Replication-relaxation
MSLSNPKRQRRDQRPERPRQMRETTNDQYVIQLLYHYRILSQSQLEKLLGKSRSRVQQVMMRLYHHEYVERLFLPVLFEGRSPTLYILDKRGMMLLQRLGIEDMSGQPSKKLSPMFLEHTLAINDGRIAVAHACEQQGWSVLTWKTENDLKADYDRVILQTKSGKTQSISVVPDSYFVIELPGRGVSNFFLELDRGTMTLDRFRTKVAAYVAYYKTGGYTKRFGAQGFRVLAVVDTISPNRVDNLLAQTATVNGIGNRFWFAHLPDVLSQNVLTEPIWRVAGTGERKALFST